MGMLDIYKKRKVLVTGHTGFKGAWLSIWLCELGAEVTGFSLENYPNDILFQNSGLKSSINDERGNIADLDRLKEVFEKHEPEIVFHLAAQSLIRHSYKEPIETISTNVMGTANVLECIKEFDFVKAGVMITTDKCYKNKEKKEGYRETDELGGHDPYSASKACDELIIESYRRSFFSSSGKLVASARAGNVIGGGDYAEDRLVPDCVKAIKNNKDILIRNPSSIRPWQHVLEPDFGYLLLGKKLLYKDKKFAEAWNFAPDTKSAITVKDVVELIISSWGKGKWIASGKGEKLHETKMLNLDAAKAKALLGWHPQFDIKEAIEKTVEWYKKSEKSNCQDLCIRQIKEYTDRIATKD